MELNFGQLIAEGAPDFVLRQANVRDAYLGDDDDVGVGHDDNFRVGHDDDFRVGHDDDA